MRPIKMLGLAVVAALVAMAFVGATTASATRLCTVEPFEKEGNLACKEGLAMKKATLVSSLEKAEVLIGVGEQKGQKVSCKKAKFETVAVTTGVPPHQLKFEEIFVVFEECESTFTSCKGKATVKVPQELLEGEIAYVNSKGEYEVVIKNMTAKVTVTCFGLPVTCEYKVGEAGITKGPGENSKHNIGWATKISGATFPCPTEGTQSVGGGIKYTSGVLDNGKEAGAGVFFVTRE